MGFKKFIKRLRKKFNPKFKASGEDARSEAAGGLIREDVKRQAGSGQVSFTEERRV